MSTESHSIPDKLSDLTTSGLFPLLSPGEQDFLAHLATTYPLSYQEFRTLIQHSRDLTMWQEPPLAVLWEGVASAVAPHLPPLQKKKEIFKGVQKKMKDYVESPKSYPESGLSKPKRNSLSFVSGGSNTSLIGDCPVASEKTVCCNLKTIDAVENCAFGCSYCTIQTFYQDKVVVNDHILEALQNTELDPERFYHIGTGQSSDSLVWGNKEGILEKILAFAQKHPNILLELKTKSANVSYLIQHDRPKNVVCSWSLNTETIIQNEEHFTSPLEQRLEAARKAADAGIAVAFHFHPIVHYDKWEQDYGALAERVLHEFSPEEVLFLSFGSVTFIKPVLKQIRERGEPSKILQMEMTPDPHGKLTYSKERKVEMFRFMHNAFRPWHNKVFMYLCMERAEIWHEVFGWHYETNEIFEEEFRKLKNSLSNQ
ncbi:MAG: hypothetical protein KDD55_11715 [Bdellovibrionales bacterium]|nr:hypothetical protein [Bdellovibrionales bacterium]